LSGYLDKCTKAPKWERVWSCNGPWIAEDRTPNFEEFSDHLFSLDIMDMGLHFRPQVHFCGVDVAGNLDKYHLVATLDNMAEETMKLLKKMGLSELAEDWPHGNMFHRDNAKGHATNAENLFDKYYTPKIREKATAFYKDTYKVLETIRKTKGSDEL